MDPRGGVQVLQGGVKVLPKMFNIWNQSLQVMGLRRSKEKRRRGLK
jgi:hypothetical protein